MKHQCELCDRLLPNKKHKCNERCNRCFKSPPCYFQKNDLIDKNTLLCKNCNRMFRNTRCLKNHLKQESIKITKTITEKWSICERYKICQKCFKFYDLLTLNKRDKEHKCEEKFSSYYKLDVPLNHNCCIQKYEKNMPKNFVIVFYDLEIVQNKTVSLIESRKEETQFLHEPILVCAQQVCNLCWEINDLEFECKKCIKRNHIFEGQDSVLQFVQFLLKAKTNRKLTQVRAIAHNARSFDAQFIIKEFLKSTDRYNIDLQMTGYKILSIEIKGCFCN